MYSRNFEVTTISTLIVLFQGKGLSAWFYTDSLESIDAGKAGITVAHFLLNAGGNVDVGKGSNTNYFATSLGYNSLYVTTPVDAGSVTVDFRTTGAAADVTPQASGTFVLDARKHYVIMALGDVGGSPAAEVVAFEMTDFSINSRLAFVHGIPADLPVNVVANDVLTLFRNIK